MADEEKGSNASIAKSGEAVHKSATDDDNAEAQSDFAMQVDKEDDPENVDALFAGDEEETKSKEEFKEGEEAGLFPIEEEGEEEGDHKDMNKGKQAEYVAEEEGGEEEEEEEHSKAELAKLATSGEATDTAVTHEAEASKTEEHTEVEEAVATKTEKEEEMPGMKRSSKLIRKSTDTDRVIIREVGRQSRYESISHRLSGDFTGAKTGEELYSVHRDSASYNSLQRDVPEAEGEHTLEEEAEAEDMSDEEEYIDREPYYELYRSLMKEYPMQKLKNNFLQRKMAEYFKRRKMEHVLRESERIGDAQNKYYKKLDALWDLRNTNNMQRSAITSELNEMKALRDKQLKDVVANFEAMQTRERDVGKGLIFTKTAKEIPEKFLERLLKNQRTKSKEIMEMRLCFIKLRNNIDEITAAIRAMDRIGEHHTLIDYEQLKMENQNHADKIEERDEELQKLRTKCAAAIQTLAHMREKSSSTDIDILELSDRLDDIEMDRSDWREKVNVLKKERDALRATIVKLQEESGLLTKPKLLLDMEETLGQIESCKEELKSLSECYNKKAVALDAIKKNIQEEKELYQPASHKDQRKKSKVWKSKPKLIYPGLEHFDIHQFQL